MCLSYKGESEGSSGICSKICFRRVLLQVKEGSLSLIPALDKAYRRRPKLSFKVEGSIKRLPHLEPMQVLRVMRGAVILNLLVETPIPTPTGLIPGLGFIAVMRDVDIKPTATGRVDFNLDGNRLRLNSAHAPPRKVPGKVQESSVFLFSYSSSSVIPTNVM